MGDSIGRQYYKEAIGGVYSNPGGLSKEDTIKITQADIGSYNVDSLFEAATLMQKQKILSSAANRAESLQGDYGFKIYNMRENDYQIQAGWNGMAQEDNDFSFLSAFLFYGAPARRHYP